MRDMGPILAELEALKKENETLKHRDSVVSLTNETLARYVREGKAEIEKLKQVIEKLKSDYSELEDQASRWQDESGN